MRTSGKAAKVAVRGSQPSIPARVIPKFGPVWQTGVTMNAEVHAIATRIREKAFIAVEAGNWQLRERGK